MTLDLKTLATYTKRHLTDEQLKLLSKNGVPLVGPQGLRRWLATQDFEAFVKLYFAEEFTLEFPDIHRQFIADIQELRNRQKAQQTGLKLSRAIPRGHAKTTYFARLLPLWGFLAGWSPLTVLLANNSTAASRLLKNIKEVCELNAAIREDFEGLGSGVWQEERIEFGTAVLICFGVGSGAIRGVSKPAARPSLVIGDDLDSDESVRSSVILEANTNWWDKSVMALGDQVAFTTSYIVVGTIIRNTSLLSHILASPDFSTVIQQGVTRFADNGALWQAWGRSYLQQADAGNAPKDATADTFYQEHKDELLRGAEVLWPRPDGYYLLMLYKLARGDAAFSSEIQNTPGEIGGSLGTLKVVDALPAINPSSRWMRFAALDTTIKGGKSNDLAAWVEAHFDPYSRSLYITHVDAKQRPYSETIDAVIDRLSQRGTRHDGIWLETNSGGAIIADLLEDRIAASGMYYVPVRVNHSVSKAERIMALPEYTSRDQLFILSSVDGELVKEYEGYPSYKFDDVIDAVATIILQLKALGYLDLELAGA